MQHGLRPQARRYHPGAELQGFLQLGGAEQVNLVEDKKAFCGILSCRMHKLDLGLTDRLVRGQYDNRRVGLREVIIGGSRVTRVHRADSWRVHQAYPEPEES